jgi:hypothetical protein
MEFFALMLAAMAFIFAIDAQSKVSKLDKRLRESGQRDEAAGPDDDGSKK